MKTQPFEKLLPSMPKDSFHRLARKAFKQLAKDIGLPEGTYEVRTNLGGCAVLGETTLHSETVYVQTSESMGIMVRSCKGKKDYTGGRNHFTPYQDYTKLKHLAKSLSEKYV